MKDSSTDETLGPKSPAQAVPKGSQIKNDLFPDMCIDWLAVDLIDAAPRRVRRVQEKQTDAVVQAVEAFGFRVPILVRQKPDSGRYEVVDGHIRLEAACRLGAEKLPCIVVDDLSDVELRRLVLSLNKLQETGSWDPGLLKLEIDELIEIEGDLRIPGFDLAEIEGIHFGVGASDGADPADTFADLSETGGPPVARLGDVWNLGDHRVLCGNARDGERIAAVLDGQIADAIFTDAPFNVPISGHVSTVNGKHPEFAEASGEMSRDEFLAFLVETLGNTVNCLKPGGVIFACMDWRHVSEMKEALEALGLKLLNICVWVKDAAGMGGLYRSQHEFVLVALNPGERPVNNVQLGKNGRNRSNVWSYAGATGGPKDPEDDFGVHPTVKPIRMVMDALLDVTAPGELVVDPFLGSGTTLLAAERTQRRCVGIEIEPGYVDLAIRRWQAMTGGKAVHAKTGVAFDALAASRDSGKKAASGSGLNNSGDKETFDV